MRKGTEEQVVRFIIDIVRRQFGLGVESMRRSRRKDQKNSLRIYHMKVLNARGVRV